MADRSGPTPVSRPAGDQRRSLLALVLAAVVVVATVAAVVVLGLATPPPLPGLDAASAPDRALALLAWRDEERSQCLTVVAPDGTVSLVRCGFDSLGPLLGWDDDGIVVLRHSPLGQQLEVLDPADGSVVSRRVVSDTELQRLFAWEPPLNSTRTGGVLRVRDADGVVVWEVESPDSYRVDGSATDASSGRTALLDSAGRLLLLERGAAEPRVWVDDLGLTYAEMVWQGTRPGGE